MSGTTIEDLKLIKVVDGDTVKVELNGEVESLRLGCLDTEEGIYTVNVLTPFLVRKIRRNK